ncbi:MAG: hypothetical protein ACTSO3_06740 [Candidatus Heimdallarchaeaceae archaeon]
MIKITRIHNKELLLFTSIIVIIIFSNLFITQVYADDDTEGDDDDFGKDFGPIAIGFFAFGTLNIIALYIFKGSRKFLGDEGKAGKTKTTISSIYQKIRNPLKYIHYGSEGIGIVLFLIHGISLTRSDDIGIIIGWLTASVYISYALTGFIIWFKLRPVWSSKTAKKVLNKFHRSLILLLVVVVIHIIHIVLVD